MCRFGKISALQALAASFVVFLASRALFAQTVTKAEEPLPTVRVSYPGEGDCLRNDEDYWWYVEAGVRRDFNAVRVNFTLDGQLLSSTAWHEIGHQLHLSHATTSDGTGGLMEPVGPQKNLCLPRSYLDIIRDLTYPSCLN